MNLNNVAAPVSEWTRKFFYLFLGFDSIVKVRPPRQKHHRLRCFGMGLLWPRIPRDIKSQIELWISSSEEILISDCTLIFKIKSTSESEFLNSLNRQGKCFFANLRDLFYPTKQGKKLNHWGNLLNLETSGLIKNFQTSPFFDGLRWTTNTFVKQPKHEKKIL